MNIIKNSENYFILYYTLIGLGSILTQAFLYQNKINLDFLAFFNYIFAPIAYLYILYKFFNFKQKNINLKKSKLVILGLKLTFKAGLIVGFLQLFLGFIFPNYIDNIKIEYLTNTSLTSVPSKTVEFSLNFLNPFVFGLTSILTITVSGIIYSYLAAILSKNTKKAY